MASGRPSIAPTPRGPLGCGSYTARLVNNGKVILDTTKTASVDWNRRNGEASNATAVIPVSGTDLAACCIGDDKAEALRTELVIERNGIGVWQGWCMREISFKRDTVTVTAHDMLKWTERRVLDDDHIVAATDLTGIATGYLADSNLADIPWVIEQASTGVVGDRTVLASEYRYASDPLGELHNTGLDMTVAAGRLYLGPAAAGICGTLKLRDTDMEGDPEIKQDGAQRATRVIVTGADGIVSIYPPSPPDVCWGPADVVSHDDTILDQATADARALALWTRLSSSYAYFVNVPDGAQLKPTAPVHINALVPGQLFDFVSRSTCIPIAQGMRLASVDVTATADEEAVKVSFEPIGDAEGIAA